MRPPSVNNKNGTAPTKFQIMNKIIEQYQRNQQMMQEMFIELHRRGTEQTKILIEALQRGGGQNINTTHLVQAFGGQNDVNETRTDDNSTAATSEKPVPHQEWLDWVERAKQKEQKRQQERANDEATNAHIEYINGTKYEWKPGNIALPQTATVSSAFPTSPNYFECLEDDDNPPTVEATLSDEYNSQSPAAATQSRAQRVSNRTKREVTFKEEVVTEVRMRPKFDNEKELSQPRAEKLANQRAAERCKHLFEVKLKSMCATT